MTDDKVTPGEARFWDLAEPLLAQPGIERSTMMGLPCLRVHGAFFASCDRRTGDLLVKLPEARVDTLVAGGRAREFAPAGRRFREWAAIPHSRSRTWRKLLDEAHYFVAALPPPTPKTKG
jgi:hypothetical protein